MQKIEVHFNDESKNSFFNVLLREFESGKKHNKTSLEKLASKHGIKDKNTVKELNELVIVTKAREIANSKLLSIKKRYLLIVDLYESQVNLSHRTSQSMILQQYSTPATISFLLGVYCNIQSKGNYYEASAGNGMLTIASDGSDFHVNEIDDTRLENLKAQNIFKQITKLDSSESTYKQKHFDAVITNPPFSKLKDKEDWLNIDGFTIKELDHKMSILAVNSMKDKGRAAIIVGGHTKWDSKGRVQAGKNRVFLSYLYRNYNVDDIINIDGKQLYSKMGTGFNVRAILINGRKSEPNGFPPLNKNNTNEVVGTYDQLYNRISKHFKAPKMDLIEKARLIIERNKELSSSSGLHSPYMPASESCFTLNVHTPDSMSYEIHRAVNDIKKEVGGNLNQYLVEKLKYKNETELCKALAAEQIDGVSTAIYNIESKSQGIIIGDQTGVGKGRQAAAMIRYAIAQGVLPIFITEKPNLFSDLYRDLEDIGSSELVPFIVNAKSSKTNIKNNAGQVIHKSPDKAFQDKVLKKGEFPKGYDFIVSTYSQFASSKPTIKQAWLKSVSNGALIVMDESHNASGSSATGEFLKDVVKQSLSTIFLSATFAKRPDNMPIYAIKTSIQDANMDDDSLVDAIQKGGVALQEVLAAQLVSVGQMIRRERTYDGIDVNYITLTKKEKEHHRIADNITQIVRRIIGFQSVHIDAMIGELDSIAAAEMKEVETTKGTQAAGVDNTPYFSRVFNVINQMLFSIKADEVANRAIKRLKEGKKPVIAFSNTMGAFIDDTIEGDIIDADFKEVLKRGLESVMSYTEIDSKGQRHKKYFSPDELDSHGRAEYYDIISDIERASTGIVVSPIDHIIQRISDAGYKSIEVTGRKKEVQLKTLKDGSITGLILTRKKENTNDAFRKFNNNEVDVLLINQSGSTGASAHAISTEKAPENEVKQRVMIVLQAELNINTEVQKRGRVNRTGQLMKPIYDYVSSAIPAEKRLQMMLQKKLKSLDANTTSNQKNSEDLMKSDDFLNKYGDEIVKQWLEENPDMNRQLGNLINEDTKNIDNLAHKASGRVAILPVKEQEAFYTVIIDQYQSEVERLLQRGEYDLEVEDVNLDAETISRDVAVVGKNPKSIFGGNTYLEKLNVNNLRKPYTKDELEKLIENALAGKTREQAKREMLDLYDKYVDGEMSNIFVQKSEKWDKVKASINNEKGYKESDDREAYYESRVNQIHTAKENDIELAQKKLRNQTEVIRRFINFFEIGKGVNYPVLNFDKGSHYVDAVCIGAGFNMKAANPFTPSNIMFSFAISDSNRRMDLKASSKFSKELQAIIGTSYYMSSFKERTIIDNWNETTRSSTVNRRTAYIVTGNILQGYSKFNKGKLVSYTVKGGGVKKGILLPFGYSPKQERNDQYVSVPIFLAKKYVLGVAAGSTIRTNTSIEMQRYEDTVKLFLPASKSQGGKYFLDESLLDLTEDNNFDKIGSKMVAHIPNDNMSEFLKILQDKFSVSAMVPKSRIDDIKEITDAINEAVEIEQKTTKTNKTSSSALRLKAKAISIKQKQIMLQIKRKNAA